MIKMKDAHEIVAKMKRKLTLTHDMSCADLPIAPNLAIDIDGRASYCDQYLKEIHIGIQGIMEIFEPGSEEDLISMIRFIMSHEEQHWRSTVQADFEYGIRKSVEEICLYAANKNGIKVRRFRGEHGARDFLSNELTKHGIYIRYEYIERIAHHIVNSIEDGRIEAKRSEEFPGFARLRKVARGRFWNHDSSYDSWDITKKDPVAILAVLQNQVLSLATCNLYEKGFVKRFGATPLMDVVKTIIPDIASGVMSETTKDMADASIRVTKTLAPYIYEALCTASESAKQKNELEKMLADYIKAMVDNLPETGLDRHNEEKNTGSKSSLFDHSDLVITLDDETYDKLMENASPNDDGDGGLMIRREHPKENKDSGSEKTDDQSSAGSNGESSENRESSETGESAQAGNSSKNGDTSENEEASTNGNASKKEESSKNGDSSKNAESAQDGEASQNMDSSKSGSRSEESKEDNVSSGSNANEQTETNESSDEIKNTSESSSEACDASKDTSSADTNDSKAESGNAAKQAENITESTSDIEDAILAAMKEAASQENAISNEDIKRTAETVNQVKKTQAKEVLDTQKDVTDQMQDICKNFQEHKRAYKLTEALPSILNARGRALRRKNEMYFRSLSKPTVRYLDSGSIDSSRIYGLATKDTQIFQKLGKDKKFDGVVYVLLDNSGSMAGDKRIEACKSAAVIEEGFKGIIPIKIVAFDTHGCVIHEVIKGFDEVQNKNCSWNFCVHGRSGGGNEDGYDIQIATRELMARPESKKLLLVLSDGTPGNCSLVSTAVKQARQKGIIVKGIYFEEGSCVRNSTFTNMYGERDSVVCSLSELDQNMQDIFKKFSRS